MRRSRGPGRTASLRRGRGAREAPTQAVAPESRCGDAGAPSSRRPPTSSGGRRRFLQAAQSARDASPRHVNGAIGRARHWLVSKAREYNRGETAEMLRIADGSEDHDRACQNCHPVPQKKGAAARGVWEKHERRSLGATLAPETSREGQRNTREAEKILGRPMRQAPAAVRPRRVRLATIITVRRARDSVKATRTLLSSVVPRITSECRERPLRRLLTRLGRTRRAPRTGGGLPRSRSTQRREARSGNPEQGSNAGDRGRQLRGRCRPETPTAAAPFADGRRRAQAAVGFA